MKNLVRSCSLLLVPACLAPACSSTRLQYTPAVIDSSDARAVIEQVFMEQPVRYRPESVVVEDTFIAISEGVSTSSRSSGVAVHVSHGFVFGGGGGRDTAKELNTRVYFSSIGELQLYKRKSWFIVQIRNTEGQVVKSVYASNQDKAQHFMDALESMRASASASSSS